MDAEDLVLGLGRSEAVADALELFGWVVFGQPSLLEDYRIRFIVDDLIEAALTAGWSTDEIRQALGEQTAARLTW